MLEKEVIHGAGRGKTVSQREQGSARRAGQGLQEGVSLEAWRPPLALQGPPPFPPLPSPSPFPLPPLLSEINNPGCSGLSRLSFSHHYFSHWPLGFVHSSFPSDSTEGCPLCMRKTDVQAGPLQMSRTLFSTAPSPIPLFHLAYLSG